MPKLKEGYGGSWGDNSAPTEPSFPEPAQPKNYDRLTPFEKTVYGALPRVTEGPIGKALDWFNKTPIGKVLPYIDIPAEGIERATGFASQWLNRKPGEDFNLRDAWYAGSLLGDVANLPKLNVVDGKVTGIRIPTDLPGVAGLADARLKIGQLVSQGMSEGDALEQVRNEYYDGLGALAFRAMYTDTLSTSSQIRSTTFFRQ